MMLKILVALSCYVVHGDSFKSFEGYTVVRVVPETQKQLDFLEDVMKKADGSVSDLDFWRKPTLVNESVDIMLSPTFKEKFETQLEKNDLQPSYLYDNLESAIEEERHSNLSLHYQYPWFQRRTGFFESYKRLAEIHNYMDELAQKHPDKVETEVIGTSTERKNLKVIKIGNKQSGRMIWLDAGLHAREWIGPATAMYVADQLTRNPQNDPEIDRLTKMYTFVILPVSNPDGYEYTHTMNRMWRKTRSMGRTTYGGICYGTDPNRNWNFQWMAAGASSNPCSDTYGGSKAFSEPETQAMAKFIDANKNQIKMYLSFHSYSQLILTPWGHTTELPKAYNDMFRVASAAVQELSSKYGTQYRIGSSTNILYAAAGGSEDWAHGACNIKYAYTFELRDTGRFGFLLPQNQIIPTGEETFAAVKTMAKLVAADV